MNQLTYFEVSQWSKIFDLGLSQVYISSQRQSPKIMIHLGTQMSSFLIW